MLCHLQKWLCLFLFPMALFGTDPFQVLGVSPEASEDEIKKAYFEKVRSAHPDVSPLPKAEAESRFKEIQRAWEDVQKIRVRLRESSQEKKEARENARRLLEEAWTNGTFGEATFETLPRFKLLKNRSPLSPSPNRSPKEEGEWDAVASFLKSHEQELILKSPNTLFSILRKIDSYTDLTAESVRAIRNGITTPLEQAIFETTGDAGLFLDALLDRLERMNRAGTFLHSTQPSLERELAFGNTPELFSKKFGVAGERSPELQLAFKLLDRGIERLNSNQVRHHELGALLRSIPPALSARDKLTFLSAFFHRLGNSSSDLKRRVERSIEQVFAKEPELAQEYKNKINWWKKLTGTAPACELLLSKLARQ